MKRIFLLLISSGILLSGEVYQQVRVESATQESIQILQSAGLDVDHSYRHKDDWIEFAISERHLPKLVATGLPFSIIHADLEAFYATRLDNEFESRDFELGSMGGYYTFAEIEYHLDALRSDYPHLITEKVSLGNTLEGRNVWMVKMSDNPEEDEGEPEMLYTGLHHAREPMSYMNLFYFMYWLAENYETDMEAKALLNNRELYFIPAVNPDGLVFNHENSPNGGGMQRKNMRETCSWTPDGVDLNRNYSFMWGYDNVGSSSDGCNETYRGSAPFSEPETNIVKAFVESHDFKIALNYHSYGNLFIRPFGFDPDQNPPEEDFEIFIEYGEAMTQFNNYYFGTGIETVGYTVNGEACDWMYGEHGIFAYTPEVGASNDGFWPATSRIIPLAEENLYPNKFAAWAVGAKYDVNFTLEEGPYTPGNTYSTNLDIFNSGLGNSISDLTLEIVSGENYFNFETEEVNIEGISARSGVELGDIFSFTVSPTAPAGVIAELSIHISEGGVLLYTESFQLILGASVPVAEFDFESDAGWTVGDSGDDATAGIWELGVPVATSFDGNQAQAGSDHSEFGQYCFLTGAATSPGSVGYDDVDGGKTTLYSPLFDLSGQNEALVSYWKWYTNHVGDNPGTDVWKVEITDDGSNWVTLENTTASSSSWIQMNFLLSETGISLSDAVQLRFIAEDTYNEGDSGSGGSIIEAAIDDFTLSVFETETTYIPGDVNLDSVLNVLDIVTMVNYILGGTEFSELQFSLGDVNGDNTINVMDIILLVQLIAPGN